MGITEVCSPVTRKGSKVGSGQPLSPGARSAPGKREDSVPPQPVHTTGRSVAPHAEPEPPISGATTTVVGPED
jgi:hypothetical protein